MDGLYLFEDESELEYLDENIFNLDNSYTEQKVPNFSKIENFIQQFQDRLYRCGIKGNKEMELVNIYFNKKKEELKNKVEETKNKITDSNKEFKLAQDVFRKYNLVISGTTMSQYREDFKETFNKLNQADEDMHKKSVELDSYQKEIEAQLDICETYEQKMNILKLYKIVNEEGMLN